MDKKRKRRKKIVLSQGEARCGDVLTKMGLHPKTQYRIALLPRYRFDYHFIYEGREYLLEFDGQQHFEFTSWFHRTQRSFYNKQQRDFLKSAVALMSGYHLIRIAYNDLINVEDLLQHALLGERRLYLSNDDMYTYLTTSKIPLSWLHQYGKHILPHLQHFDKPKRKIKIVVTHVTS